MSWITAGRSVDPTLPTDRLDRREHDELYRLLGARESLREKLAAVEQRMELFLVSLRDARGMTGPVSVNADTGEIRPCPLPAEVSHGG